MKRVLALLAAAVLLVACQKEIDGPSGSGGGGTTPTTPVRKCTGCSYLPVCDSTKVAYLDSSAAGVDTVRSTQAILGDTTINGTKFTRVSPFAAFPQGLLYNCDGGTYKVYQAVPNLGLNIDSLLLSIGLPAGSATVPTHIQATILKTTVAAGSTWSDTVVKITPAPFVTIFVKLDYKLEEKGVQRTVLGKTYNNVMQVSSTLNAYVPLSPPMPLGIGVNTWYADGVGIIESRTTNNGAVQNRLRLL